MILSKTRGDRYIWLIVIFLTIISMLVVYSSTASLAFKHSNGNTEFYLLKHFLMFGFGLVLMYLLHKINYKYYSRISQVMIYISVPLLIYTLLFGQSINDARRWINIPVINMSFQTSDLAKLSLMMYMARVLSKKQEVIRSFRQGFLPVVTPPLIICGLIAPSNLSTAAILFATCLLLMFIGRVNLKYIMAMLGCGLMLLALIVVVALQTPFHARVLTWESRMESFFHKDQTHSKDEYQVQYSMIAIAEGGWIGQGPGSSGLKDSVPESFSDYIYIVINREYGFVGAVIVLLLYLFFLLRCIRIFLQSPNAFGAFLAVGLSFSITIQALINMGVVVHILPVTGVTLPLVSMGGTSIWFMSAAIGIILSVSKNVEQESEGKQKQLNEEKSVTA